MQVKQLEKYIFGYKTFLKKDKGYRALYKWEAIYNFQKYWDVNAPDFAGMYNKALESSTSRRLWNREAFYPKKMMLRFLQMEPEFVRSMFKDLFDESKTIVVRSTRFKFCCDELLKQYKDENATSIENNHYHGDSQMLFLYLCFNDPQKYTLYDFQAFLKMMRRLNSIKLPEPYDVERFVKISRALLQFLQKDDELIALHNARLPAGWSNLQKEMLLVHDFYTTCSADDFIYVV